MLDVEGRGPNLLEISHDRLPSLEELGREGSLIAVVVDLTRVAGYAPLEAILGTLNREDFSQEEAIRLLGEEGFRRVSLQKKGFSDKKVPVDDEEEDCWMRPPGKEGADVWDFVDDGNTITLNEEEIKQLVVRHMSERPSVDFGLGERSPLVDDVEKGKYLNVGVVEPGAGEGDSQEGFWN